MENIAKVLLIEKNCAQLIALTVWLKQFPELHVNGTMSEKDLWQSVDLDSSTNYDLIIYGLEITDSDEVPLELAMALSFIRKTNAKANSPIIILLTRQLSQFNKNNITSQICQQLLKESDGQLCWTDSLQNFGRQITTMLSQKKASAILTSKVG